MKLLDKFLTNSVHRAMAVDVLEGQHALSSPVSSPDQIQGMFDIISHSKGET